MTLTLVDGAQRIQQSLRIPRRIVEAQRQDCARTPPATSRRLLDCYLEGWAEANPAKILQGVAPNYRFKDPFIGVFAKWSLPRYFEILRTRCTVAGASRRAELAFLLHGPNASPSQQGEMMFWREAPGIGLTGDARIKLGELGVIADHVTYDLNLASGLLRERGTLE